VYDALRVKINAKLLKGAVVVCFHTYVVRHLTFWPSPSYNFMSGSIISQDRSAFNVVQQ